MSYPVTGLTCVSNVFCKMMHFKKAGDVETGHKHQFDHVTLIAKGSLQIEVDGVKTVFKAPHVAFIRKEVIHELTALEDDTLAYCIHGLRDGDGVDDIIAPENIPLGADAMMIGMARGLLSKDQ